jgi:hypothetical protein
VSRGISSASGTGKESGRGGISWAEREVKGGKWSRSFSRPVGNTKPASGKRSTVQGKHGLNMLQRTSNDPPGLGHLRLGSGIRPAIRHLLPTMVGVFTSGFECESLSCQPFFGRRGCGWFRTYLISCRAESFDFHVRFTRYIETLADSIWKAT